MSEWLDCGFIKDRGNIAGSNNNSYMLLIVSCARLCRTKHS